MSMSRAIMLFITTSTFLGCERSGLLDVPGINNAAPRDMGTAPLSDLAVARDLSQEFDLTSSPDLTPLVCFAPPVVYTSLAQNVKQVLIATDDKGFTAVGGRGQNEIALTEASEFTFDGTLRNADTLAIDNGLRNLTASKKYGGYVLTGFTLEDINNARTRQNVITRVQGTKSIDGILHYGWLGAVTSAPQGDFYASVGWHPPQMEAEINLGEVDQRGEFDPWPSVLVADTTCAFVGGVGYRNGTTVVAVTEEHVPEQQHEFNLYYYEGGVLNGHATRVVNITTIKTPLNANACTIEQAIRPLGVFSAGNTWEVVWKDLQNNTTTVSVYNDTGQRVREFGLPYDLYIRKVVRTPNGYLLAISDPALPDVGVAMVDSTGNLQQYFSIVSTALSTPNTDPFENIDHATNIALTATSDGAHVALVFVVDDGRTGIAFFSNACH